MIASGGPAASELPLDGDLWRFALSVYTRPGVSETCLALQESLGLDVNILLFVLWAGGERGVVLTSADLEAAEQAVLPWHQDVVRSLRAVRQRMKHADYTGWTAQVEALRNKIKRTELDAERIELARLQLFGEGLPSDSPPGTASANANLHALLARIGATDGQWTGHRGSLERAVAHVLGGS